MTTASGAQPRNLDYYLQRMSGYSKNTIKIQPQSKATYNAGDTIVFRLPTNSILDLHTLQMRLAARLSSVIGAGDATNCALPRYTQSFFRRVDWTMGGMQAGMGSLHDYGYLYQLLAQHKVPVSRSEQDLKATDLSGPVLYQSAPLPEGTRSAATSFNGLAGQATTPYKPLTVSSWLGLPAGNFMRFLDTNILPDIELRILLAPNAVIPASRVGAILYELSQISLTCESISFGDGSYRAIVDSRMATGDPLLVPFYNWSGFEGHSQHAVVNQQFTIGTESLNALIGTIRPGNYDSQNLPAIGGPTANGSYYVPPTGDDPQAIVAPQAAGAIVTAPGQAYSWYHTAMSFEKPLVSGYGASGRFTSNYQFNIDSKLYPQFLADPLDAWSMMKNLFDANALSLTYGGSVSTLDQFLRANFMFCVGLDHHSDDAGKDHLISGLNTTGSLIPITFNVNGGSDDWTGRLITAGNGFRPTVFANMTSTLMIYQGRTITVVN